MNKRKYLWFLLLLIPLAVFVIFLIAFCVNPQKAEWLTLSLSTSSSSATIVLGVMVYIQAERHKEIADNERVQDLKLRANPHAIFNGIDCIRYTNAITGLYPNNTYNRLFNIKINDYHDFDECVYMDLRFSAPGNNVLERIFVKKVVLKCYKGAFLSDEFEEIASFELNNYSKIKATNIKLANTGDIDSLVSLYFDSSHFINKNYDCFKTLLDTKEYHWAITFYYSLSNSFGITINYSTHLNFSLSNGQVDEYGDDVYNIIKPIVTTIQISNIELEQTNESDS